MHKLLFLFCFDIKNNFGTQHVLQMLQAFEKDLPVLKSGPIFDEPSLNPGTLVVQDYF